jgi:hypothetical protein
VRVGSVPLADGFHPRTEVGTANDGVGNPEGNLLLTHERDSAFESAAATLGDKGERIFLLSPPQAGKSWLEWLRSWIRRLLGRDCSDYFYEISDRDEGRFRALRQRRDVGISELADGRRTFSILEGELLPTSHGQDLYLRIFGDPIRTPEKDRTPNLFRSA